MQEMFIRTEKKRSLGISRRRDRRIKSIYLKETRCGIVAGIKLFQARVQWQALVNLLTIWGVSYFVGYTIELIFPLNFTEDINLLRAKAEHKFRQSLKTLSTILFWCSRRLLTSLRDGGSFETRNLHIGFLSLITSSFSYVTSVRV